MISIIAVNYKTKDWCDILIDSIIRNSEEEHEIIIVDNSGEIDNPKARVIKPESNLRHCGGADLGVKEAKGEFILLLDIDSHILRKGWEKDLFEEYNSNDKVRIVGAKGGDLKPYRPCVMFFRKDYFIDNNFSFEPVKVKDMSLDVGVYFAMKTLHSGFRIMPLQVRDNIYQDVWGDTYYLKSQPTFYHNWYSARFMTGHNVIDGRRIEDFKRCKDNLFKQYEIFNSNNSI
jgi:hypothetical protein